MRLLLFTGKGGVGKTTVAAATAVHAVAAGVKTVVLSADPAHSLGDVLDRSLTGEPGEVVPGLFAAELDPRASARGSWNTVRDYLVDLLDGLGVEPVAAEELTDLPSAQDLLALLDLRAHCRGGNWDLVVLDCAPTAQTLRLLALPELLDGVVDRLLPGHRRVARALSRSGTSLFRGASRLPVPPDHVIEAVDRLRAELVGVREVLSDAATSVRLVLTPESLAIAEARRTWTALSLFGYVVDGVVVNRIVPAAGGDPWRAAWAGAQARRLDDVASSFAGLPVLRIPHADREPVGVAALTELGEQAYGSTGSGSAAAGIAARLLAVPEAAPPLRVEREGSGFVLVVDLPLARRGDVELSRRGDDLLIGVANQRRVMTLPSVLRRCVAVAARVRDGRLRVVFEPDPDQWRQS